MNEVQRTQHEHAVKNTKIALDVNAKDVELAAKEQAYAASKGIKVLCGRVKKWVDMDDCAGLYFAAIEERKPVNPCWQCAKIETWVKKHNVKKSKKMGNQKEIQPFAGWEKYEKKTCYNRDSAEFVRVSLKTLCFSSAVVKKFNLQAFQFVDLFFARGKIGCILYNTNEDDKYLVLTKNVGEARKQCSLVGAWRQKLLDASAIGRHTTIKKVSENAIEITLEPQK